MKCKDCVKNIDIAQIPFIEHEYRMFKAYEREHKLKTILGITNGIWLIVVLILLLG